MTLRRAYNRFRLVRGVLAIALIVNTAIIFLLSAACAIAAFDFRGNHDFETSCKIALGCVPVVVLAFLSNRQSITYEMTRSRGLSAWAAGNCSQAEKLLKNALTLSDCFSQEDPRRGDILHELARIARRQGHFDDAEVFGRQAIVANERAWGRGEPETIRALENLAETYRGIARYKQAQPLLEDALQRRETRAQVEPMELAKSLNAMGEFWLNLERPDKAEPYLRRAKDLAELYLDRFASPVLPYLVNLSEACAQLKKLDEADELIHEALGIARKTARPHSLSMASCLYQLADVRRRQERYAEAEESVRNAIAILQEINPSKEPIWHDESHLLGDVLRAQGRWAEAEECFQTALRFRDEYLAPEDLATARLLEDYAELLELMNRTEEAHVMEHRAKFIRDFHSPFRIV
jgi:tetratricopeptide (TPR) repeat protein